MTKYFTIAAFCAALLIISGGASRSAGASAINFDNYPHMSLSTPRTTSLDASACANNAQEALKRSGYTGVGSSRPGNGLYGRQGAYVAGIVWDAKRGLYYTFVAGPDKATVMEYEKTLLQNAQTLLKS